MNNIAALDSGTAFHIVSLHYPPFNTFFKKIIYLPGFKENDLVDIDILIVTCSSHLELLIEHKQLFLNFLNKGKTLVVMGRNNPEKWLPNIEKYSIPFNYWWWLKKENEFDMEVTKEQHILLDYIKFEDMIWHYHGAYEIPKDAVPVLVHKTNKKAIYFEQENYLGGGLIVTSLDPFFHHGSFFMPNTTKFAAGFLKYLSERKTKN